MLSPSQNLHRLAAERLRVKYVLDHAAMPLAARAALAGILEELGNRIAELEIQMASGRKLSA